MDQNVKVGQPPRGLDRALVGRVVDESPIVVANRELTLSGAEDFEAARRHLELLGQGEQQFTFQLFQEASDERGASILHGTLDELWDKLVERNREGYGVFVTVQETDLQGRRKENIHGIRAVFRENDVGGLHELPLPPHFVIESSPGKYHEYLLVEPNDDFEGFDAVMRCMVESHGSDKNAKDCARVLRLAGLYHRKDPDNPHLVHIHAEHHTEPYSWDRIKEAFPALSKRTKPPQLGTSPGEAVRFGEGARNSALTSLAGVLRCRGISEEALAGALQSINAVHCDPPLPEAEVDTIAGSVARYPVTYPLALEAGEALRSKIYDMLAKRTGLEHEQLLAIELDAERLGQIITSCFWNGPQSKLHLLAPDGLALNQFKESDAWTFILRHVGTVFQEEHLRALARQCPDFPDDATSAQQNKWVENTVKIIEGEVLKHIKDHNQRSRVSWHVDMFASRTTLSVEEDWVRVQLTHRRFEGRTDFDQRIVDDFREHFPEFDSVLDFIVMARFASYRKDFYLWLQADSDFGKGMLIDLLRSLGIAVELSVKEIEGIFEGKPAGRSPEDFKRAFAVVIDEFKAVKSEIKMLENSIPIQAKYQLTSEVDIFAKLFFSAEEVPSLVSEEGVETQFANRMCYIKGFGNLNDREVHQEYGRDAYFDHLLRYTRHWVNELVAELQQLGPQSASERATRWVRDFRQQYGIEQTFGQITDNLKQIGENFRDFAAAKKFIYFKPVTFTTVEDEEDGRIVLKNAKKLLDYYLENTYERPTYTTLNRKKAEILKYADAEGKGYRAIRINGKSTKGILIKDKRTPEEQAAHEAEQKRPDRAIPSSLRGM